MEPGEVVEQLLTPARDRFDRWERIRSFLSVWDRPLTPADGCTAEEVAATEGRLGVRLPLALREMYQLFGRRTEVATGQDHLYSLDRVRTAGSLVLIACENQGNWQWGVRWDGVDEDPPLVVDNPLVTDDDALRASPGEEVVHPTGLTVSEYALANVVRETGVFRRELYGSDAWEQLEPTGLRALPLPTFMFMGYDEREGPQCPDELYVHELGAALCGAELYVAPRDPSDRDRLQALIPPRR